MKQAHFSAEELLAVWSGPPQTWQEEFRVSKTRQRLAAIRQARNQEVLHKHWAVRRQTRQAERAANSLELRLLSHALFEKEEIGRDVVETEESKEVHMLTTHCQELLSMNEDDVRFVIIREEYSEWSRLRDFMRKIDVYPANVMRPASPHCSHASTDNFLATFAVAHGTGP
eukprot:TRINITY_DN12304_c0_g1_i2.p2 TRINITY_DN12304_c0_g1~~TRINITY_DN12304_c0_g1_i2.p2  ORF type:complete len:171 (+),score=23.40 TRINITY_DN12304_c0_g1_i2:22-534(+)